MCKCCEVGTLVQALKTPSAARLLLSCLVFKTGSRTCGYQPSAAVKEAKSVNPKP